jgi:hypothetical protein
MLEIEYGYGTFWAVTAVQRSDGPSDPAATSCGNENLLRQKTVAKYVMKVDNFIRNHRSGLSEIPRGRVLQLPVRFAG